MTSELDLRVLEIVDEQGPVTDQEQKRRIPPLVEALEAEDISTVEVLVPELRQDNERARRLAQTYGFRKCAPPALPGR